MTNFNTPEMRASMQLFMLRGAYGYNGFSEHIGGNMYKVDSKAFRETLENATEPIDPSKVSTLSAGQMKMLNSTASGNWMIPLLNRMGQLGMMDLREGLANPKFAHLNRNTSYNPTINAYKRSI
ncbi:hypothetical protein MKY41_03895 [Sporosarcina sp. FSL W7-1349]|uniref:hypothetical protein n=1 Tax=Sporosarcina sp. FSL W7-1349 TaxID=2921561 RepID=UPI0030FB38A5